MRISRFVPLALFCFAVPQAYASEKKNVSLDFEGQVVERYNASNPLLDSVNVTNFRQRERTRKEFKQKDFRKELQRSLREVEDIQ